MTETNDLRTQLEGLSWSELKQTAKKSYAFNPPKEFTRAQIVDACLKLSQDTNRIRSVTDTNKPPEPGYSRIRIHKHSRAGGEDPVQISVNCKELTIQRDAIVDIPHKFVNALKNTVNDLMIPDGFTMSDETKGRYEDIAEEERNFSFDLLGSTPGPDPMPTSLERQLRIRYENRRKATEAAGEEGVWTDARWRLNTGRAAYQGQ